MPCTMSLTVPTALRATYDHLATMSSAVARRYVEVATVVQPAFTPAEFAIWTRHCLQLAQSGWRAWESVDAFLQLSPFLQQRLVVDDLWTWAEHGVALARYSAEVATAFFHAAKPLLQEASHTVFAPWVAGSRAYLEPPPFSGAGCRVFSSQPPYLWALCLADGDTLGAARGGFRPGWGIVWSDVFSAESGASRPHTRD